MTAQGPGEAVENARGYTSYDSGYCLRWVRTCWEIPGVYASAIEAWDGARFKHKGDRHPPKAAPCFYRGGDFGHIVLFTTDDRMRSTDCTVSRDVSEAAISWCEQHWGYDYLGWTEDLNGVTLPGIGEEEDMPLSKEDKDWITDAIRQGVEDGWQKIQGNDNSRGKNLNTTAELVRDLHDDKS